MSICQNILECHPHAGSDIMPEIYQGNHGTEYNSVKLIVESPSGNQVIMDHRLFSVNGNKRTFAFDEAIKLNPGESVVYKGAKDRDTGRFYELLGFEKGQPYEISDVIKQYY